MGIRISICSLCKVSIECGNDAFLIKDNESEEELERIKIEQNESDIDTENRIEKLKKCYDSIKNKYK